MRSALPFPLIAVLLLGAAAARGQSLPVLSQNPPSLRWQALRSPHFELLYPAGLDSAARRTAGRLEAVHAVGTATLGVAARPIAVVLQNQTTQANGFVTFLPRRAEFFTTPQQGQGLGTVDWLDGLVVHEFRHVGQFDKARQGVGRVLKPLLGDPALGLGAVGVPQWWFEGDAVGAETALTRSGRGRIPYFGLGLRANLLAGRRDGYQKAVNGSLRDFVPDWYVLGYYLSSAAKARYGGGVWGQVLDGYYRFPFYPFSFSASLRRRTGLRVEDLYARTLHELDSTWRRQQAALPPLSPAQDLAGQYAGRVFTQYQYPQYVTDSTVLALKSGLGHIPQLVLLGRRGAERRLWVPGLLNLPEMLAVGGGRVVWPEFRSHPRWRQQLYSELKVLDLRTGRCWRLGRGGRWAAAALSPDGQRLVAMRTDAAYRHALVLLDANTGAEIQTLPNPRNAFYQQPRFTPDGRQVVAVTLTAAGKTIELLDPATGAARPLLPVANVNLANPQPWADYVLYNSPQSGLDNLYAVHTATGQTYRVSSRPLGAYHAAVAPDGRHLAFHDYRAPGARIAEMPLAPATWTALPAPAVTEAEAPYVAALAAGEPGAAAIRQLLARPDSAPGPRYGLRRYRPLAHAFRLFSYGLVQSPTGEGLGLGLRSQDLLSTTQVFAGLGYDPTERTLAATGALSYQGLGPVLDVEGSYGGRNAALTDRAGRLLRDQWQYARLLAGLRLPLVLTRSRYLQALTVGAYYLHERVYGYDLPLRRRTEVSPNAPLHAVQAYLSYVGQLRQSARDVAPRGGGALLALLRTTPFGTPLDATQLGLQGTLYAPGLGRHHALRLRGGYQHQQQSLYQFAPAIAFPRGEGYVSFDRLLASSADYSLPLAFPHLALGRLLYVQRLRATLFADVAEGTVSNPLLVRAPVSLQYRNVGLDVAALFNVLRLRTPLEAGVRVTHSSLLNEWVVEPLAFDIRI